MLHSGVKMSPKRGIGKAEYMDKMVPKNAKYQHVKTKLDTGCSLTKYMERLEDIRKNYRYRPNEIFRRLTVTTLAQMILQVSYVSDMDEGDDTDSHGPDDGVSVVSDADLESLSVQTFTSEPASIPSNHDKLKDTREIPYSARSTLQSVINGMGELDLDGTNHTVKSETAASPLLADGPYLDCPYLLLDVRDRDHYDRCHIISAHSFPIACLSRVINPYSKEVMEYRNAAGKIIILYDEDERMASHAATTMCQRGFNNLFMLSGGLKVVAQKFPAGLVTGPFPTLCLSSSSKKKKGSLTSPPSLSAEKRWRFTADELAKIEGQLEELFLLSDSSSRTSSSTSSCGTRSEASSARSRQSSQTTGRTSSRVQSCRPWK